MYLYRLIDSEEDCTKYEDFIITEEETKDLIEDCIVAYNDAMQYETIGDLLKEIEHEEIENGNLYIIDKRVMEELRNNADCEICCLGGVYEFIIRVLENNNIRVMNFEEEKIYY